jgi:hypothetical protein
MNVGQTVYSYAVATAPRTVLSRRTGRRTMPKGMAPPQGTLSSDTCLLPITRIDGLC